MLGCRTRAIRRASANEPFGQQLIGGQLGADDLDRHLAVQGDVAGQKDHPHPAPTQFTPQGVPVFRVPPAACQ